MQRWTSRDWTAQIDRLEAQIGRLQGQVVPEIEKKLYRIQDDTAGSHREIARCETSAAIETRRVDAVELRADKVEAAIRGLNAEVLDLRGELAELGEYRASRAQLMERQRQLTEGFLSSLSVLADRTDAIGRTLEQVTARFAAVESQTDKIRERQDVLSRSVALARQNAGALIGNNRLRPDELPAGAGSSDLSQSPLDLLYLEFEDRARGTREDIKGRQSVYLSLVRETGAGTPERPILDIGAGRGEWLELLQEQSMHGHGIDANSSMVALCQTIGLPCRQADALASLRSCATNSLGMITGFHIIEHLPFETFVAILDEALRALAPGAVILLETPDPDNVLVGSKSFYMDPTHRNPMPSGMVRILAEARGFYKTEIRRLHPSENGFHGHDSELIAQLNELFFGPQDYAFVGTKP